MEILSQKTLNNSNNKNFWNKSCRPYIRSMYLNYLQKKTGFFVVKIFHKTCMAILWRFYAIFQFSAKNHKNSELLSQKLPTLRLLISSWHQNFVKVIKWSYTFYLVHFYFKKKAFQFIKPTTKIIDYNLGLLQNFAWFFTCETIYPFKKFFKQVFLSANIPLNISGILARHILLQWYLPFIPRSIFPRPKNMLLNIYGQRRILIPTFFTLA